MLGEGLTEVKVVYIWVLCENTESWQFQFFNSILFTYGPVHPLSDSYGLLVSSKSKKQKAKYLLYAMNINMNLLNP